MRVAFFAAVLFISACAGEGLRSTPPAGVDFSGEWKLNVADSDDPLHLLQLANAQAIAAADNSAGSGGSTGGRGGRGGRGGAGFSSLPPPATPPLSVLTDASRFPGKQLDVQQVGAVLTFSSSGQTRVCRPGTGGRPHHQHHDASDRDEPLPAARDAPPPRCGWFDKTLVVRSSERDDDHPPYEEHYSISDDGQRLIEEVIFSGGRSSGFSISRVWDRSPK